MLRNDRINLIIALLIAFCLWAYVVGDKDPVSNDVVRNVPIHYINEDMLENDGLVVISTELETVNITYSGKRSEKKDIKADDFRVTADLGNLVEGENRVKLVVTVPEGIEFESLNVSKVKVVADRLVEEEKKVSIVLANQNSDESEPYIVQVSDETIKVKGARSLIDKIVSVNAVVDASKVTTTMKSLNIKLRPVDSAGRLVENVTLEKTSIAVVTELHKKKTIPLKVNVIGLEHPYITREISLPKTITVKGNEDILSQINYVTCESLDVSDIYESETIELKPVLPEGIKIATNSEKMYAKITVTGADTREFEFNESDIEIEGFEEDMMPYAESISVTVKISGNASAVEAISKKDITLSVDVSGLNEGKHIVPLKCVCENKTLDLEYNPAEVVIVVERPEE